jgi:hypothetical protein
VIERIDQPRVGQQFRKRRKKIKKKKKNHVVEMRKLE